MCVFVKCAKLAKFVPLFILENFKMENLASRLMNRYERWTPEVFAPIVTLESSYGEKSSRK